MCLRIRDHDPQRTPYVTKRPIVVWKSLNVFYEAGAPYYMSPFYCARYTLGELVTSELRFNSLNDVAEGLHAYVDSARPLVGMRTFPAVIPVGARVFFGRAIARDIVSDKLIVYQDWAALLAAYPGARDHSPEPTAAFVE